jgi:hypothetical protein
MHFEIVGKISNIETIVRIGGLAYMIIRVVVILIFFFLFTCSKNKDPLSSSFSMTFVSEFATEPWPNAITADKLTGHIYVSNDQSGRNESSRKIQKYTHDGKLITTIVDYNTNTYGKYERYIPHDLVTDDASEIYVLVMPLSINPDSTWSPLPGFCIMSYNDNGMFLKEYDFTSTGDMHFDLSLAYHKGILYVTNQRIVRKITIDTGEFYDFKLPLEEMEHATINILPTADMAVDKADNIWLTGQVGFNDGIGCHFTKFDATCQNHTMFYSKGLTTSYGAALNFSAIAFDAENNLYLSTGYCKSIEIYNREILFQYEFIFEDEQYYPLDIAIGKNSFLYILNKFPGSVRIYKLK